MYENIRVPPGRSYSCIINKEISLYKYVDIITFFLYGAVIRGPSGQPTYGLIHMGPMWIPVSPYAGCPDGIWDPYRHASYPRKKLYMPT